MRPGKVRKVAEQKFQHSLHFLSELCPQSCSELSPKCLRPFRALFPRKRRPLKIHQEECPPSSFIRRKIHKCCVERRQSKNLAPNTPKICTAPFELVEIHRSNTPKSAPRAGVMTSHTGSGQVRPRQGTEICNFGGAVSLEALHWIFCFFSSVYVQFSKTSLLKSGESSEKSSGENRVKSCHVSGCHSFSALTGTNALNLLPSSWGWPPFGPTQTGLCEFGWAWSSLNKVSAPTCVYLVCRGQGKEILCLGEGFPGLSQRRCLASAQLPGANPGVAERAFRAKCLTKMPNVREMIGICR